MRDPDVIVEEMKKVFESQKTRKDPYGAEKFRDLFMEHLESLGYAIEKTRCGLCGYVFDVRGLEERWETQHEDGIFKIVYICPNDNTHTPLDLQRPKGIPSEN
jgi:hypothetical protein